MMAVMTTTMIMMNNVMMMMMMIIITSLRQIYSYIKYLKLVYSNFPSIFMIENNEIFCIGYK